MRSENAPWSEGEVLWQPSADRIAHANVTKFRRFLEQSRGLHLPDFGSLWRFSVEETAGFWAGVWDYFAIESPTPYQVVVEPLAMPSAAWFPGTQLNFASRALARDDAGTAIIAVREDGVERTVSFSELRTRVASVASGLRRLGVQRGDRVVAVLPNSVEATIAFLATATIGAVWSSCAPEYGARSLYDRFGQLEPKVLIAADGYLFAGRRHDTGHKIGELRALLTSLEAVVVVSGPDEEKPHPDSIPWSRLEAEPAELDVQNVPFDHPLWILYSSGTTGQPKAIVHSHGGILLSTLLNVVVQMDLGPEDRFFWYTTTSWVLWNVLVAGLLAGSTIVLFEGSPLHPSPDAIWALAARLRVTYFGHSSNWYHLCEREGLEPGRDHDLSAVRTVGATGSPLLPETNRWIYRAVSPDVHVASASGGTELCGPIVGGVAVLPVRAGELQHAALGYAAAAWDESGKPVVGQVGELVLTRPTPSMPLFLWGDDDGSRLHESYFDTYPGVWRHGDWVLMTSSGGSIIYGRSDATLNRGGVRTGTSEFYRVVEQLPGIADSLVIDTTYGGTPGDLVLFVKLAPGAELDDDLIGRVEQRVRSELSPRHVPDRIMEVPLIPYTLTGKKCEVPVKRLLLGASPDQVVSRGVLADPAAFDVFVELLARFR